MTDAPGRGPDRKVVHVLATTIHFDAAGAPTYGALPLAHRRLAEADASLTVDIRDLYFPDDFVGDDVIGRWAELRGVRVEGVNVGDLLWSLSIDFFCPYFDEDMWNVIQTALDREDPGLLPSFQVSLGGDLVDATVGDLPRGG